MKILKLFCLLTIAIFAACGGAERSAANAPANTSSTTTEKPAVIDTYKSQGASANKPAGRNNTGGDSGRDQQPTTAQISLNQPNVVDTAPTDRKIIRNADLSLESANPEQVQQKITSIAESKGGFVVESQQSSSDIKISTRDIVTMTVRVPSQKFLESLDEVRKSSDRVLVETVKGEDVTDEYVDIEARLRAKKALEQQFVEIMKRANTVDDALTVQRQLGDVRTEIEKIEGRRRFLENQSSLSTIKLRIQTPAAFSATSSGFFYKLGQSFSTGLDFALSFVLGLVTVVIALLPFAIVILLPLALLIRYLIKRLTKQKSVSEIVKEETQTT